MSRYTFTFKKDNIFVEFTTADKDVVERQFQIWVADADEYAKKQKGKGNRKQDIEDAKNQKQNAKGESLLREENLMSDEAIQTESLATEKKIIPEIKEEQPKTEQPKDEEPVFDKASSLLKTINSINEETGNREKETEETNIEPTLQNSNPLNLPNDFDAVLEQTIENPTFEPEKNKDAIFLNLINSKNTKDKFHYLIIASFYLSEFEKLERFSLKQINAKLMQNISEAIDHGTLQEAINQGLMELVPDLTGVSEAAEYRLTRAGEEFFANKI